MDENSNNSLKQQNEHTVDQTEKEEASSILEHFQMLSMKKQVGGEGLNLSVFDKEQKDMLLKLMDKNEDHAFQFSQQKIRSSENIALKEIDASIVGQKTMRIVSILVIVGIILLALLILFLKEEYFVSFLTFVAGLFGGTGITSLYNNRNKAGKEGTQVDND